MALMLKITYFVLERAAEPISERLERAAAKSTRFRHLCKRIANTYANVDYYKQLRRVAHEQRMAEEYINLHPEPGRAHWTPSDDALDVEPPPVLTEKEATQRGCELLGEGFVLSVGIALLLHQVSADSENETRQQETIEANNKRIRALEESQAALLAKMRAENHATVALAMADVGAMPSSMQVMTGMASGLQARSSPTVQDEHESHRSTTSWLHLVAAWFDTRR